MSDAVFVYATDTVWGIGGNIHEIGMAAKVNKIKGYDEPKPLSVLFAGLDTLSDYFDLNKLDKDWLKTLFSMEATLGLPVSWLTKEIPKEVYNDSDFICVRVLDLPHVQELIELAGGPVYTTSFNFRSEPPLTELEEAKKLRDRLCPEAHVLGSANKLSGHSSTIIFIKDELKFDVLRPGQRIEEIEGHIKLLAT